MDFTIVTPSFGQIGYLGCCIASVADQEGVSIEHIVQDAGTPGFAEFAEAIQARWPDRPGYRRIMISELDGGMYDAINKGLKKGKGEFCAYLNCDEQYLPGALAKVAGQFRKNPRVEVLCAAFLVTTPRGHMIAIQRPLKMSWRHVATCHLPNFTCATFFRRLLLERDQAWFDSRLQACGDAAWTVKRLQDGICYHQISDILATFTEKEDSLGLSPEARAEAEAIRSAAPWWVKVGHPIWKLSHQSKRFFAGHFGNSTIDYGLYLSGEAAERTLFKSETSSLIWNSRGSK